MSRKNYNVKMPWGETLIVSADLTQASAPICTVSENDEGEEILDPTPYQTADAAHRPKKAVMLVIEYCNRDWYANPNDDRDSSDILAEIEKMIRII